MFARFWLCQDLNRIPLTLRFPYGSMSIANCANTIKDSTRAARDEACTDAAKAACRTEESRSRSRRSRSDLRKGGVADAEPKGDTADVKPDIYGLCHNPFCQSNGGHYYTRDGKRIGPCAPADKKTVRSGCFCGKKWQMGNAKYSFPDVHCSMCWGPNKHLFRWCPCRMNVCERCIDKEYGSMHPNVYFGR